MNNNTVAGATRYVKRMDTVLKRLGYECEVCGASPPDRLLLIEVNAHTEAQHSLPRDQRCLDPSLSTNWEIYEGTSDTMIRPEHRVVCYDDYVAGVME